MLDLPGRLRRKLFCLFFPWPEFLSLFLVVLVLFCWCVIAVAKSFYLIMLLVFMLLINYDLKTLFCLYYTHPPAAWAECWNTLCSLKILYKTTSHAHFCKLQTVTGFTKRSFYLINFHKRIRGIFEETECSCYMARYKLLLLRPSVKCPVVRPTKGLKEHWVDYWKLLQREGSNS